MKRQKKLRGGPLLGVLVTALLWVAFAATPADALVAAGTSIGNSATVSYAEGLPATSNTVTTVVNLVSALAWDDTSLSPVTQTYGSASGLTTSYTVDLVNLGNGKTTATISDGTTQSTPANLTTGTWTINGNPSPVNVLLGATVSSGAGVFAGVNTEIPVSFVDLAALAAGDTVRIGGNDFVVATGSTATKLIVVGNAESSVSTAGVQIGEVATITFTGTTGSLSNSVSEFHNHRLTATDNVGGNLNVDGNTAATDIVSSNANDGAGTAWQTGVTAGVLTIQKYVRNVTSPMVGALPGLTYGGSTYYQSGVKGDSTVDTLEYLIVITNGGPGDATSVTVTDTISTYLALDTASVDIDTNGDGTFDVLDAVAGAQDAATFVSPLLTVYAGVGGVASTPTGGTIVFDATPKSAIRFKAAIQ